MKAITNVMRGVAGSVMLFFFSMLFSIQANAQQVDVGVNQNNQTWYTAWWVWVGLALFVIVLVSIVGASKTDNRR